MTQSDAQVLEVFRALPGHCGCSRAELDVTEKALGVCFPKQYRAMMELDSKRLGDAGIVAPLDRLEELRREAGGLLIEDGHLFRLERDHVVFAWDDDYGFYFFKADRTEDPVVMLFNYYDSAHDWKPVIAHATLMAYFADAIRRYLKLG